jgi:hypothetical protein
MLRLETTLGAALAILVGTVGACNQILGVSPGETGAASGSTGAGGTGTTSTTATTTTSTSTTATTTTSTATTTTSSTTTMTGTGPASVLLAPAQGPSEVPDGGAPFESKTVTIERITPGNVIVLSEKADGTGTLYVDDNIHVIVTPQGGSPADQYYEFWVGYPCPAASMTVPDGGSGSGLSPSIDISALFSTDTSKPQQVTLEFWHCANHVPAPHSSFYLVQL